jgi:hypothetical protein
MEFLYGILIVAAGILGFVIGAATSTPISTQGTNNNDLAECDALCNQWDRRRQERCNAEADARAAQNRVISLAATFAIFQAAAIAAWVAVGVAAAGFWTLISVPALIVVAVALTAIAAVWAGALTHAIIDSNQKEGAAQQARTAEAQARSLLLERCSDGDRVSACLSRTAPC